MRPGSLREAWLICLGLAAGISFSLLVHGIMGSYQPEMIPKSVCQSTVELVIQHANMKVKETQGECVEMLKSLRKWQFENKPGWIMIESNEKDL